MSKNRNTVSYTSEGFKCVAWQGNDDFDLNGYKPISVDERLKEIDERFKEISKLLKINDLNLNFTFSKLPRHPF